MRKVFFDRFVVYTACHRQTHARCQTKFYGELSNQVQHFLQFLFKQICRCFVTEYFFRSTSASSRRSRGSIRKHLAVLRADARAARYESISPYPIGARYSVLASLVLTAQSEPKTGSTAQVPLPFSLARPCLALRSVPLMGTEIVTRLCLDISISRHPLSAIAIPSRTLSAPYNSPQLHQRFEQTLARLDTIASRRTLSELAIPSSLRSSLRLKRLLIA